ncbi:N-alpha-acetyltransferase [Acrasis kona]|uniref:N-alpha-acetyltransferase n=1 Tax=Acrasis kona TaxID=1008807 RepID=A0AAW2Z0D4_9EUKA
MSQTEQDKTKIDVTFDTYKSELQLPRIKQLMDVDLSEPYSIYTYRYFVNIWPHLCFLCYHEDKIIGAIVCKADVHNSVRQKTRRGYIAMLAVDKGYRKRGLGSQLIQKAIEGMIIDGCDEAVLETEEINTAALKLYENLGFVRDKKLHKYYLNQGSAYRLKLYLK